MTVRRNRKMAMMATEKTAVLSLHADRRLGK